MPDFIQYGWNGTAPLFLLAGVILSFVIVALWWEGKRLEAPCFVVREWDGQRFRHYLCLNHGERWLGEDRRCPRRVDPQG
jgi:hypothetical protein